MSARARASISSAVPNRFSVGASVTLRRTLYCGNRLNCWNTSPKCRRAARTSASRRRRRTDSDASKMHDPATYICPASAVSRKFRHRSRVVLPPPEEPIRASTAPRSSVKLMPRSTSVFPKDLPRFRTSSAGGFVLFISPFLLLRIEICRVLTVLTARSAPSASPVCRTGASAHR